MRRFLRVLWLVVMFPFRAIRWLLMLPVRAAKRITHFLTFEPEDRPLSEVFASTVQQPASLFEHIASLRKHIFRMLLAVGIGVGICAIFTQHIISFLAGPIGGIQTLQAIDVTETVGVFMRVALLGGFSLALPYIAFELWLFVAPGLHARARRMGLLGIPLALIFFVLGMAFAYRFLLPSALKFLLHFMDIQTIPRVSSYINFITGLLFWIGISFEFPLVIYVLTLMGIVKPRSLTRQWRVAVVVIAVVAAAITPTVDPVNMTLVMLPMVVLYFISIGLSYLAAVGRKKRQPGQSGSVS